MCSSSSSSIKKSSSRSDFFEGAPNVVNDAGNTTGGVIPRLSSGIWQAGVCLFSCGGIQELVASFNSCCGFNIVELVAVDSWNCEFIVASCRGGCLALLFLSCSSGFMSCFCCSIGIPENLRYYFSMVEKEGWRGILGNLQPDSQSAKFPIVTLANTFAYSHFYFTNPSTPWPNFRFSLLRENTG